MEKLLQSALVTLGCTDKEIRLFVTCFSRGAMGLTDLAKLAHVRRSTAYLLIKPLLDKGLMTEDHASYGRRYSTVEPETLLRLIAAKQRLIGRQRLNIEEHLGELQALHQTNQIRPQVRTYQGVNGLLAVQRDILTATGEILLWTNQASENRFFNPQQHDQFIRERRSTGRFARVLAIDNVGGHALQEHDAENLRETRLLPLGTDFQAETYVYDHKVAVLDFNQDIIGIITESTAVAQAQRAMFETAWNSAIYS